MNPMEYNILRGQDAVGLAAQEIDRLKGELLKARKLLREALNALEKILERK